ncbi:MAG: glycosyltransferase family 2 protein [Parvularculaceae bacterium]|nr:glycosyltransferase family 2 protein [Parvularculaceae bacterium]
MIEFISLLLTIAGAAVLAITIVFAAEVVASFFYDAPEVSQLATRGRIVVLIPAHNEVGGIAQTVALVVKELAAGDRVIVVADNCSDETAEVARAAGAVAIERSDPDRVGKGFAMQFGVDYLRPDPPEAVIFLDADCIPVLGAIDRIAKIAHATSRPVQALYLANPPANSGAASSVSAFAWLLINRVRMSGLQALGGFSRLTGSGMALPWELLESRKLSTGEIVEDLALTTSLIEEGHAPLLDLRSVILTELARTEVGAATQRARWEIGSMRLALRKAGMLFGHGLSGDRKAFLMALDLLIPPLTVLGAVILAGLIVSILFVFLGHSGAFQAFWIAGIITGGSIAFSWLAYGRTILPPATFAGLGGYLVQKIRVYFGEGRKSAERWTRTDRGDGR